MKNSFTNKRKVFDLFIYGKLFMKIMKEDFNILIK